LERGQCFEKQENHKEKMVIHSNAAIKPETMVISPQNTFATLEAMR
jgi:hypothetical protein